MIAEPGDVDEVLDIAERHAIAPRRIYLMAEGTENETLAARERWLAPICIDDTFNFSKRLHIQLFGDSRGT